MSAAGDRVDLLVVGGGVTGAATAAAAARRGLRTVLAERFTLGNPHGSSHGPSRIIRLAYEGAGYVTLAREAYVRWRALERERGARLLLPTGGLDFGLAGTPSLRRTAATMESCGVAFERLPAAELAARFPQLRLDPGMAGLYQPDAGVLDADACVRALAGDARAHGAEIREHARVRLLRAGPGGVGAEVNGTDLQAGAAVLAAGSWTGSLLAEMGRPLPLVVTREQVAYFAAPGAGYRPGTFPVTIEHRAGRPPMISMFPRLSPEGGVKLMLDRNGPEIDADDLAGTVDERALAALTAHARHRLPGLGPVLAAETCRYTMAPDEDFVLDLVPGLPRVGVASACSGHGFKFGPVLGEIMVDLITAGTTARPVAPFRLDRPALVAGRPWSPA
ncbi:N-methyltryptophan oxidase [Sphaerisporangium rufum]|uniref:N-methyltryptophan oxidase n=1 Tax=Sphaerisporangium rufum TaxID=1381558 RepID=A0A919V3N7_9ACTN|nr:N-methyl-L-tryptophan oxidase [Sphaerisporangium rufum]GII76470.1 N-methyltryptophan oxidase [Sphaerisporangium rufum]